MEYPTNKAADEHFENLRKQFADGMQAMRNLVDDQLDSAGHLNCIEDAMRRHAKLCEDAMVQNNPQKMVDNTSAIARLANRALMVGKRESDNSEDPSFVNKINTAADRLQSGKYVERVPFSKEPFRRTVNFLSKLWHFLCTPHDRLSWKGTSLSRELGRLLT